MELNIYPNDSFDYITFGRDKSMDIILILYDNDIINLINRINAIKYEYGIYIEKLLIISDKTTYDDNILNMVDSYLICDDKMVKKLHGEHNISYLHQLVNKTDYIILNNFIMNNVAPKMFYKQMETLKKAITNLNFDNRFLINQIAVINSIVKLDKKYPLEFIKKQIFEKMISEITNLNLFTQVLLDYMIENSLPIKIIYELIIKECNNGINENNKVVLYLLFIRLAPLMTNEHYRVLNTMKTIAAVRVANNTHYKLVIRNEDGFYDIYPLNECYLPKSYASLEIKHFIEFMKLTAPDGYNYLTSKHNRIDNLLRYMKIDIKKLKYHLYRKIDVYVSDLFHK